MLSAAPVASAAPVVKSKCVEHIVNNPAYPNFIRTHAIFQHIKEIYKVFPSIGLSNFSEDIEIDINQSNDDALALLNSDILPLLNAKVVLLSRYTPAGCLIHNFAYNIANYYTYMVKKDNGKVTITIPYHIYDENHNCFSAPGESFFKAYNKLVETVKPHGVELPALESYPFFRSFSAGNVAGSKKKLVFSSTGKEGAWDIATMSMRGITSCQKWETSQSRGLIGSISSKFVGVCYITNDKKFNEHGTRMLRRCVVRFCLNTKTNKPALLCDKIYPIHETNTANHIKKVLSEKSKLPVFFPGDAHWNEYILPEDTAHLAKASFGPGDLTYMDHKIPIQKPKKASPAPLCNFDIIQHELLKISSKAGNIIAEKLGQYQSNRIAHQELFDNNVGSLLFALYQYHNYYGLQQIFPSYYSYVHNKCLSLVSNKELDKGSLLRYLYKSVIESKDVIETSIKNSSHTRPYMYFNSNFELLAKRLTNVVISETKSLIFQEFKNQLNS